MDRDLQRIENAMETLVRVGQSRRAATIRAERAGVRLTGAAQRVLRHTVEDGPNGARSIGALRSQLSIKFCTFSANRSCRGSPTWLKFVVKLTWLSRFPGNEKLSFR